MKKLTLAITFMLLCINQFGVSGLGMPRFYSLSGLFVNSARIGNFRLISRMQPTSKIFTAHTPGQGHMPRRSFNTKQEHSKKSKSSPSFSLKDYCALFLKMFARATGYIGSSLFGMSVQKNKACDQMPGASIWELLANGEPFGAQGMAEHFVNDCHRLQANNLKIPLHTKNSLTVRMATYNVHFWAAPGSKNAFDNVDAIMQTIEQVNADIWVLQEVVYNQNIKERLADLGYEHQAFYQGSGRSFLGNMIICKYPFAQLAQGKTFDVDQQKRDLEYRCFIKAPIALPNGKQITVYGTHLDVYDQTEKRREAQIAELVAASKNDSNCIIAADFNAVRKRDYQYIINGKSVWSMLEERSIKRFGMPVQTKALALLERSGFADCFTQANLAGPKFTVWTGTAVDFLYLKNWNLPIKGCYVYYSGASDHVPVIVDVDVR